MEKVKFSLSVLFFWLLCSNWVLAQANFPLSGHPRLFFLSGDEAPLKAKLALTPQLNKVHELIVAEANQMLGLPVQQRELIGKRLLGVSRESIRRISFLSYSYRMTGDARYAERAESEMLAVAAFTDWNPSHFLDVGEMTLAMVSSPKIWLQVKH